jgi:hypothetical protein
MYFLYGRSLLRNNTLKSTINLGPLSCLFQQQTVCHVVFAVGVYFYTPATTIVQAAAMSPAATATLKTAGHQQDQGCQ